MTAKLIGVDCIPKLAAQWIFLNGCKFAQKVLVCKDFVSKHFSILQ